MALHAKKMQRNERPLLYVSFVTSQSISVSTLPHIYDTFNNHRFTFTLHFLGMPHLVAQLPEEDEDACTFFIEWRTRVRCDLQIFDFLLLLIRPTYLARMLAKRREQYYPYNPRTVRRHFFKRLLAIPNMFTHPAP